MLLAHSLTHTHSLTHSLTHIAALRAILTPNTLYRVPTADVSVEGLLTCRTPCTHRGKLRPNSGKLRPNSSNAELQCTLFSRVSNPSVSVIGAACSHYRIRPRYCTNLLFFPRTLVTI